MFYLFPISPSHQSEGEINKGESQVHDTMILSCQLGLNHNNHKKGFFPFQIKLLILYSSLPLLTYQPF